MSECPSPLSLAAVEADLLTYRRWLESTPQTVTKDDIETVDRIRRIANELRDLQIDTDVRLGLAYVAIAEKHALTDTRIAQIQRRWQEQHPGARPWRKKWAKGRLK